MFRWLNRVATVAACVIGLSTDALADHGGRVAFVPPPPPGYPVYVRPPCPSTAHVWYEGQWVWAGDRYAWSPGYWAAPAPRVVTYRAAPQQVYYRGPVHQQPYVTYSRPYPGGRYVTHAAPPPPRVVVVR